MTAHWVIGSTAKSGVVSGSVTLSTSGDAVVQLDPDFLARYGDLRYLLTPAEVGAALYVKENADPASFRIAGGSGSELVYWMVIGTLKAGADEGITVDGDMMVNGKVGGRNVSADGAKLDSHVNLTTGNPHKVTAADVGALSTTGGTIAGDLSVANDLKVKNRSIADDRQKISELEAIFSRKVKIYLVTLNLTQVTPNVPRDPREWTYFGMTKFDQILPGLVETFDWKPAERNIFIEEHYNFEIEGFTPSAQKVKVTKLDVQDNRITIEFSFELF